MILKRGGYHDLLSVHFLQGEREFTLEIVYTTVVCMSLVTQIKKH